jgi:hypothetical protein
MVVGRGKSKFKDPSLGSPTLGSKGRRTTSSSTTGGLIRLSLIAALVIGAAESGARLLDSIPFQPRNYVAEQLSLLKSAYPSVYDPNLGYVPEPSYSSAANPWNVNVTTDDLGLRTTEAPPAVSPDTVAVLAVGDSFTFGGEVSDAETWPARLSEILAAPVANAGVFGYGLDQSVLRAERLAPVLSPWAIVVAFKYEDILRTELVQRAGVEKPYFEVVEGQLQLRNSPPQKFHPRIAQLGVLRTVAGYSYLADFAMRRFGLTNWWYAGGLTEVRAHQDGPSVSCLLMRRLGALEKATGARVLLVAQYVARAFTDPTSPVTIAEVAGSRQLLDCAETQGLATIDTYDAWVEAAERDPSGFLSRMFVRSHMSATGNQAVADTVADGLFQVLGGD